MMMIARSHDDIGASGGPKIDMVAIPADAAPGLALGFTSHDMPQWFRLAGDVLFGASSKVTLHAPQNYPADPHQPGLEGFGDADSRVRASAARWSELVTRGRIRADLGPGGAGWAPYGQLHGLTPAGVATNKYLPGAICDMLQSYGAVPANFTPGSTST